MAWIECKKVANDVEVSEHFQLQEMIMRNCSVFILILRRKHEELDRH